MGNQASREREKLYLNFILWVVHSRSAGSRLFFSLLTSFFLMIGSVKLIAADLPAVKAPAPVRIIREVIITGNNSVSASEIISHIRSRPGAVFDEKMAGEDARRVVLMPQIYSANWHAEFVDTEANLIFEVTENSRIASMNILGNKHIKTKKLLKGLKFEAGDFLDRYLINRGLENIIQVYQDKGYYQVKVTVDEELLEREKAVVYQVVEGPRLRVKKVKFQGNDQKPDYKLRGKVKTKAYLLIFSKGKLDYEQLEQDRLMLESYYQDEGFLDARVFWETKFNEARTRVVVVFNIDEGRRYKVAQLIFEGNKDISQEQLMGDLKLQPGQVFTGAQRILAQRAIERAYGKEGYIYTRVAIEPRFTEQEGEVDVVFKIKENLKYNLGEIIVQGNTKTKDKVVRRVFNRYDFLPGGLYDTSAMERARTRLLGEGYFESLNVSPVGNAEQERDALVEVTEGRTGLMTFGVGVDTDSGIIGQFLIEQRNYDAGKWPKSLEEFLHGQSFTGAGQLLQFNFQPGTEVTQGRIRFYEPYLFDQPYYLDTSVFLFRRWRESYLEKREGGNLTLGRRFENDWSTDVTLRGENINVSRLDRGYRIPQDHTSGIIYIAPQDVIDVKGDNFLTSVSFGVGRDTTDRRFRPTEGYKIKTSWEEVGAVGGDFDFASVSAGGTLYHTVYMDLAERKTIWAARLLGSQIIGDAPVFERFYAGGETSIRGFRYRGVSPRAGRGMDPIGSDYLVLAGTELTHPLFEETIYGKLFCDSGIVDDGPYRVSVGFGLELVVPQLFQMIPMEFNFGFPLVFDDLDEKQTFSFSFGGTLGF